RYGQAANNLSQALSLAQYNTENSFTVDGLSPAKNYYFQMTAIDQNGQKTTSDIFTFKTAEISTPPTTDNNVVVIASKGNILVSDVKEQNQTSNPVALLTVNTPYEITYRLKQPINLKSIEAVMQTKVLGTTTFSQTLGSKTMVVPMIERSPSVYVAGFTSVFPGTFEVFVRIQDVKGNLIQEKIAETKIMPFLSVSDKASNQPLADARVFLLGLNTKTHKYEPLDSTILESFANPNYTNLTGDIKVLLPPGSYQAQVSAFGYDQAQITFTIGPQSGQEYPQILLHKNTTSFMNYVRYYQNAFFDFINKLQAALDTLAFSVRFFNLIAIFVLLGSSLVTFLFFHMRTHVAPSHLLPYFLYHLKGLFKKHTLQSFCATVVDEDGKKLSQARVETLDEATGEVVTSFISNKNGICYIINPLQRKKLKLLITKEGFMPKTVAIESDISSAEGGMAIVMRKGEKPSHSIMRKLWIITENIGGLFFEFSLLSSLILEIAFVPLFGIIKTAPFFVLSLFNLLLWIFYQKEKNERKVFRKV
ncbi:MAG TPA: hypothetical protein VE090_04590, partial [Methylomirabilota bacterium]|nr:hypothetical protein [Methylomirabilota bacterium]